MAQQINRALTAIQNMVALINTGSTYTFTGSEFTFGNPANYVPVAPDTSNTEVILTAVEGSGFVGTKSVKYRRLALGATRPGARVNYTIDADDTLVTLKEAIAQEHNLVAAEFDLTGDLPAQGEPVAVFTLTAKANSLLYTGSTTVNVEYPA